MKSDDILIERMTTMFYRKTYKHFKKVGRWLDDIFNIPKRKVMQKTIMHHSKSPFIAKMCNISLNTVTEHEYLGICLHHKLSWVLMLTVFEIKQISCWASWNEIYNASTQIKEYVYKQLLIVALYWVLLSHLGPILITH